MTAVLAVDRHRLKTRLSISAAALFGVAAGWTLWMGFLLLRAYDELARPSTKAVMLLVMAVVAAAQCAAGSALQRRRRGGRWLASGLSAFP